MVTYELSREEKLLLKQLKVNQKMLREYAPDEIAAMLNASPERARELAALAEFQIVPSLGIGFAKELIAQGYYSLEQLKGKVQLNYLMLMKSTAVVGPIPLWKIPTGFWFITLSIETKANAGGTLRRNERLTVQSSVFCQTGR